MNNSVLKFLLQKGEGHAARASENQDVANLFLGVLSRCVVDCQDTGRPIEGVTFGDVYIEGDTLKSTVRSSTLAIGRPPTFLSSQYSDMNDYLAAKSGYLMLAMKQNSQFNKVLCEMLDALFNVCRQRGWRYRDLKITKAFISKDGDIVAQFARG